jgi:hypothetical protein
MGFQPLPPTQETAAKITSGFRSFAGWLQTLVWCLCKDARLLVLWQKEGRQVYGIGETWFVFGWRVGYAPGLAAASGA